MRSEYKIPPAAFFYRGVPAEFFLALRTEPPRGHGFCENRSPIAATCAAITTVWMVWWCPGKETLIYAALYLVLVLEPNWAAGGVK